MATRREFLKSAGIAAVAMPFLTDELFSASRRSEKTGLALYTIRDAMAKNPAEALKAVASLGFNWVEAAGYEKRKFYGMKPKEFRKLTSGEGLDLISTHNAIRPENDDVMIEDAALAGLKYLVIPSLPHEWYSSVDGFRKAAGYFNRVGEKCRKNGIRFGFHNHQIEFNVLEGKIPYDILLNETDPELVTFEIDLAWIKAAGKEPVEYFRNYPGRFELWHFKDLSTEKADATIGEGVIDFRPIYAESKTSGLKYWFIEQDNCNSHPPMESITCSRNFLLSKILRG